MLYKSDTQNLKKDCLRINIHTTIKIKMHYVFDTKHFTAYSSFFVKSIKIFRQLVVDV